MKIGNIKDQLEDQDYVFSGNPMYEIYQTPEENVRTGSREPCVMCGIRGELGCRHRKPYETQLPLSC